MKLKILSILGKLCCVALIISCFLPWTFNDVNSIPNVSDRAFTGFYSYQHHYGMPAKFIIFFAVVIFIFMVLPKVWAKRANLFFSALLLAYCFKSFILYASCYDTYCPQKKLGIFIMLISSIIILLSSVFPNINIEKNNSNKIT